MNRQVFPSLLFFGKICATLVEYLNVWYNLPAKQSGSVFLFAESFLISN